MQEIYSSQNKWKLFLALFGGMMLLITMYYSNYLATKLKENEEKNANLFLTAMMEAANDENLDQSLGIIDTIISNFNLPVIFEADDGYMEGYNFLDTTITNQSILLEKKDQYIKSGLPPLEGVGYFKNIYYFNSKLTDYINYYPYVQILLVGLFIWLGYFFFNTSRKAEQNRVWAGMAKETAHQLGTPISAILAWIEHLREYNVHDEAYKEILAELEKDVDRLDLVADRFSKIGSHPDLIKSDIYKRLFEVEAYMKRRASRKIIFDFPKGDHLPLYSNINEHLFDWVAENLIRNSLDAMSNEGKISAQVYEEDNMVCIDLSDTGKGIAQNKFNTIFKPGYSTKQRGWGLGLSLAKRIIEEYHKGKIFVKQSILDEGTTFTIKLPKV